MPLYTHRDLEWFHLANAGDYQGKARFYDFKARFLKRFGTFKGIARQKIHHECWSCDGTGIYAAGVTPAANQSVCRSCGGDGIYRTATHHLELYQLGDTVYHVPWKSFGWPQASEIVEEFEGRIKHAPVDNKKAYRCFLRLVLRWEPVTFWEHVIGVYRCEYYTRRMKFYFCLIRLRNKLDLFPAVETKDDVPF